MTIRHTGAYARYNRQEVVEVVDRRVLKIGTDTHVLYFINKVKRLHRNWSQTTLLPQKKTSARSDAIPEPTRATFDSWVVVDRMVLKIDADTRVLLPINKVKR